MHMSAPMLRTLMFYTADLNRDNKMSEQELTWFFRNIVRYDDYVAQLYGRRFIRLLDGDNDGGLNRDGTTCLQKLTWFIWTIRFTVPYHFEITVFSCLFKDLF